MCAGRESALRVKTERMVGTYDCCLEGEPKREGKDVAVVLVSPFFGIDSVVWMKEHNKAGFLECCPDRLESVVVQALAEAP